MQPDHLITTMTVFAAVWSLGAVWACVGGGTSSRRAAVAYAALGLGVLASALAVATVPAGQHAIVALLSHLRSADPYHLTAAALGVCLGLGPALWPWRASPTDRRDGPAERLRTALFVSSVPASFLCLALFVLQDTIRDRFSWSHSNAETLLASAGGLAGRGDFKVEEYFTFADVSPVQLAVGPDGALYVTHGTGAGGVMRVATDPKTGQVSATTVATNLHQVSGVVFHGNDLYVSRSGRHSRADDGLLREANAGAITRLRDLDGDGLMDHYQDVIADLPGSQAPDPIHQNNGIAIGPDGYLYIAIGTHANLAPAFGQFDGTIIRSRLDGSDRSVVARGMRNPFDCAFGPDAQLFCTDNDVSFTQGNELNHVRAGGHYGHPYVGEGTAHPRDATPPISTLDNTLQGLAYSGSTGLPPPYRDRLFSVSYGSGELHVFTLERDGQTYRAERRLAAIVRTDALDVAIAPDGRIYVSCHESRKIYRLTYIGTGS